MAHLADSKSLLGWVAPVGIATMFGLSAFAKLQDPDAFGVTLFVLTGGVLGETGSVALGLAVGVLEAVIAAGAVVWRTSPRFYAAVGAVVVLLSLVLVRMLLMANPPSCGCLASGGARGSHAELAAGLVRNAGLLWLIAWHRGLLRGAVPDGPSGRTPDGEPLREMRRPSGPRATAGFTMIELLVVIAGSSLLLAIVLPALGNARAQAHSQSRSLVVRQLAVALDQYTTDHSNTFPYFASRNDPIGSILIREHPITTSYFRQSWFWVSAVVPDYFPDRSVVEPDEYTIALSERGFPETVVASRILLTYGAFASPRFFDDTLAPEQWYRLEHFRPTRTSEIRFPAQKALLIEGFSGPVTLPPPWPIAMADGSAKLETNLDDRPSVERPYMGVGAPILSTPLGLAGRDF